MRNFTDDQKLVLETQVKLERCRKYVKSGDILKWGKLLFPHKFYVSFCSEVHQYFVDIKDIEFTVTLAPRHSAKTTIRCFLIPLYLALNIESLNKKYYYFLNVQSTHTKSREINIGIKDEIENNPYINELYGDQVSEKWTETLFILKNGCAFHSLGAGESIRGINIKGKRPDYIIVDDLYDDEDISNIEQIKKKTSWALGTLKPTLALTKNNCIHIQGTAIHKEDVIHLLSNNEYVTFKKFKAIKDFNKQEVLWPEALSFDHLLKEKKFLGSFKFNREYQNDIINDEDSYIREKDLRFYDDIPTDQNIIDVILAIDPSVGKKESSDPTGIAVVYKTVLKDSRESYRWYIRDIFNERLSFQKRIDLAISLNHIYNFKTVIVEAISGFGDFSSELKRVTNLPIKEIHSVLDKIKNLGNNQSKFENNKVFIYNKMLDQKKTLLIEQLVNNYPTHDDIRDAVFLALNHENKKLHFMAL